MIVFWKCNIRTHVTDNFRRTSCEIDVRWIPEITFDESTLVQVMAWCRQTTSYYLSQYWHMASLGHKELMQDCGNSSALAVELPVLHWAIEMKTLLYWHLFDLTWAMLYYSPFASSRLAVHFKRRWSNPWLSGYWHRGGCWCRCWGQCWCRCWAWGWCQLHWLRLWNSHGGCYDRSRGAGHGVGCWARL